MALAAPLIAGLGIEEHHARVGCAAGKAEAHDRKAADDVVILADDGFGAAGQRVGVGQRRARRGLHDDDQVALVLLGNEAGGNVQVDPGGAAQPGEEDGQQQVAQPQRSVDGACVGAGEPADRGVGPVDEGGEGARNLGTAQEVELIGTVRLATQEQGSQGWRKRQRIEGRNGDGEGDGQRKLAIENAGGAREEGNRHKNRNQNQRGGDDGAGHLAHGARSGLVRIGVLHGDVALDVLDDHDGVVHHQAGGQRNAEESERIDGKAKNFDESEGSDQRNRNGDGGDDGGAPIQQKEEDDADDDHDGHGQRNQHFANRVADHGGRVEGDGVFQSRRKFLRQIGQRGLGRAVHFEGVGVRELFDADAHRVAARVFQRGAIILGADHRMAYIPEQHQAVGGVLDDDVVEFLGTAEPAYDAHRNLEDLPGIGGRLAELAGGNLDILLGQRRNHVGSGERAGGHAHRVKPDAHGVLALAEDDHIAHAGHALEGVLHVDVEVVGDELLGVAAVEGVKAGAEDEVAVGFGNADAGRVDGRRQPALDAGHAVLHVNSGDVQVVAGLEGCSYRAGAAIGARRTDVAHSLDAVDRLFQRNGDRLLDRVGVGAHVVAIHLHLGRRQRGVHGDREGGNADRAGQNNQQCADGSKDWPANKEIDEQGLTSFLKNALILNEMQRSRKICPE